MIVAFDVYYYLEGKALVAAATFESWDAEQSYSTHRKLFDSPFEYVSGKFYLRELKPILSILSELPEVDTYVIDGYCHLDGEGKMGIGAYLYNELPPDMKVIGVAKNPYQGSEYACKVYRGESKKPLYVTSIGIPYDEAGELISSMHGDFRMPTLLKEVDSISRETKLDS